VIGAPSSNLGAIEYIIAQAPLCLATTCVGGPTTHERPQEIIIGLEQFTCLCVLGESGTEASVSKELLGIHHVMAIPAEHAIHGFHSAAFSEEGYERTAAVLTIPPPLQLPAAAPPVPR
jgi:hypothetical protein